MSAKDMLIPLSNGLGTIDSYIQAANRYPMLTQEEELNLATRWSQEADVSAARQLVLSHLRLVIAIARGYLGYGLPHADLIQEGNIGLMKAVKRFDPTRGVRLVSFAIYWIKAEINEYVLKNWRLVKIATTKAQRKLFFNLRTLKKNLGAMSYHEANEMANTLSVKPEEVLEMEMRLSGQDICFDQDHDDDDPKKAPDEYLTDIHNEPSRILEKEQGEMNYHRNLDNALSSLDDRSRRIIEARWLNEEHQTTLQELADEFSVSAERIRQIEQKAMQKMKVALVATQ